MNDQFSIIKKVACSDGNFSCPQLSVLSFVYKDNIQASVKEFASLLNVSKPAPAVARALDKLEKFNLIKRTQNKYDKRRIIVMPTQTGQDYFNHLISLAA